MLSLENIEVVIPGGGSGPITIEDSLLDFMPNITAITNATDNGGHTFRIRTELGLGPVGDPTQRMAVRIRSNDPELSDIAARWRKSFIARSKHNGDRASNSFLSEFALQWDGSIPPGIKDIETVLRRAGVYKGRVIPVSDEKTHLRTILDDGRTLEEESALDEFMKTPDNYLACRIVYADRIQPNPEALDAIARAHAIIIPPGSRLGSIHAVLEVPGISEAIQESSAQLICFTNAIDVKGWRASQSLRYVYMVAQRPIDLAIVNTPDHPIPENYEKIYHYPVEPDIDNCKTYAKYVVAKPVTKQVDLDGFPTIRHDGEKAAEIIMQFLANQAQLAA